MSDLDAIRARHERMHGTYEVEPCDTAIVLAALDAALARVAELEAENELLDGQIRDMADLAT